MCHLCHLWTLCSNATNSSNTHPSQKQKTTALKHRGFDFLSQKWSNILILQTFAYIKILVKRLHNCPAWCFPSVVYALLFNKSVQLIQCIQQAQNIYVDKTTLLFRKMVVLNGITFRFVYSDTAAASVWWIYSWEKYCILYLFCHSDLKW